MFYSTWLHKTVCITFIEYAQSSIENNNKTNLKHTKTHQLASLFTDISTEILRITNQIPR